MAKKWTINEQEYNDLVTGIGFKFEVRDDGSFALHLYGDFEFGNRTLGWDAEGNPSYAGTHLSCHIREIPKESP